jgi:hypothetical protein
MSKKRLYTLPDHIAHGSVRWVTNGLWKLSWHEMLDHARIYIVKSICDIEAEYGGGGGWGDSRNPIGLLAHSPGPSQPHRRHQVYSRTICLEYFAIVDFICSTRKSVCIGRLDRLIVQEDYVVTLRGRGQIWKSRRP